MIKDKDCPKKTFALIAHGDKIDKCFNVAYLISGATKEEILSDSKASYLVYMRMCIAHTLQNVLLDATIGAVLNRTHASAWHWKHKFNDLYQYDATFRGVYDRFEQLYSQQ